MASMAPRRLAARPSLVLLHHHRPSIHEIAVPIPSSTSSSSSRCCSSSLAPRRPPHNSIASNTITTSLSSRVCATATPPPPPPPRRQFGLSSLRHQSSSSSPPRPHQPPSAFPAPRDSSGNTTSNSSPRPFVGAESGRGSSSSSSTPTPTPTPATTTTTTSSAAAASSAPASHDRGPASSESTQTDFSVLDVLGGAAAPSTSVDACLWDGFHLNSGAKVTGGAGVLLVGGEAFAWRPWAARARAPGARGEARLAAPPAPPAPEAPEAAAAAAAAGADAGARGDGGGPWRLRDARGMWAVETAEAWGLLGVVWPKPDLLIVGVGPSMAPLSPETRRVINSMGIRVDVLDTRNAAAQFNLLATERGVGNVAAALIPVGWREGRGVVSSR